MHRNQQEEDAKMAHYWACRYYWAAEKRNDIDLDDLQQAAYLGIMRARKAYDPEKATFGTYAGFYARYEIRALLGIMDRKMPPVLLSLDEPLNDETEDTRLDMVADESIPDPDDALIAEDLRQTVRDAVNRLQEEQREVIALRFFEGLTYQETAAQMQIPQIKAKQIYNNAKRNLRHDRYLRALAEVNRNTNYMRHVGVMQFNNTMTSAVEDIVMWRERMINKLLSAIDEGKDIDKDREPMV
jgi:RNA polymerase sigma-B factor